jgi:hypothetical protein
MTISTLKDWKEGNRKYPPYIKRDVHLYVAGDSYYSNNRQPVNVTTDTPRSIFCYRYYISTDGTNQTGSNIRNNNSNICPGTTLRQGESEMPLTSSSPIPNGHVTQTATTNRSTKSSTTKTRITTVPINVEVMSTSVSFSLTEHVETAIIQTKTTSRVDSTTELSVIEKRAPVIEEWIKWTIIAIAFILVSAIAIVCVLCKWRGNCFNRKQERGICRHSKCSLTV